jgi:hypothetical protein
MTNYPDIAAVIHPTDGAIVLVRRGQIGFWPAPMLVDTTAAELFNRRQGITPAMRQSMQIGSVFGWNVPGADPVTAEAKYPTARSLVRQEADNGNP